MPAHYAKSENRLRWNFQMRKTQIKTCQFHCAGKCWCASENHLRRGDTLCFAQKLKENKSFSWPSLVIFVHIRTLIITRNLDTCHWLWHPNQCKIQAVTYSMRAELCMSQQVWPFSSRVARSPPEALLAGFRSIRRDPFPYTALI